MPNFPGNDLRLLSLKGAKAASGRPFWPLWPHSFGLLALEKASPRGYLAVLFPGRKNRPFLKNILK